jgi:hypothetical protein
MWKAQIGCCCPAGGRLGSRSRPSTTRVVASDEECGDDGQDGDATHEDEEQDVLVLAAEHVLPASMPPQEANHQGRHCDRPHQGPAELVMAVSGQDVDQMGRPIQRRRQHGDAEQPSDDDEGRGPLVSFGGLRLRRLSASHASTSTFHIGGALSANREREPASS